MKNMDKPLAKNSARENIDLFIKKKSEADSGLIDYKEQEPELEQEQEN